MREIEVVAAVITEDNKVFCAQRKDSGETALKWEFPGGKIEPGETREEALVREIREELGVRVDIGVFIMTVHHAYSDFNLAMHAYFASVAEGDIALTEHLGSRWLSADELFSVDWAEADVPIVESLVAGAMRRAAPESAR